MNIKSIKSLSTIIKIISDIFVVAVAFLIGYQLKFKLFLHFSDVQQYGNMYIDVYLEVLWLLVLIWILTFVISGSYKKWEGALAWEKEVSHVFNGILVAILETLAFTFVFTSLPQSRYVIVYAGMSAFVLLFISRGFINWIKHYLIRKSRENLNAFVIGADPIGQEIAEKMILYPSLGFSYAGTICDEIPQKINYHLQGKFNHLGYLTNYRKIVKEENVKAIFVSIFLPRELHEDIVSFCDRHNILLRLTPTRSGLNRGKINFNEMDGVPMLHVMRPEFSKYKCIIKRMFDLMLVIPLLLISLPLMLVIAFLIKRESEGQVIYKQKRVGKVEPEYFTNSGKNGFSEEAENAKSIIKNTFYIYKFRTMVQDAEKNTGPTLTNDEESSKITKIGKVLRKTSLDELPQLFNILKGDMSLIGPRPERPIFHKRYAKEIHDWNYRLMTRGGITGWAQVNGRAKLSSEPIEKSTYDLFYINNWSIMFDLKIIVRTLINVVKQENVY